MSYCYSLFPCPLSSVCDPSLKEGARESRPRQPSVAVLNGKMSAAAVRDLALRRGSGRPLRPVLRGGPDPAGRARGSGCRNGISLHPPGCLPPAPVPLLTPVFPRERTKGLSVKSRLELRGRCAPRDQPQLCHGRELRGTELGESLFLFEPRHPFVMIIAPPRRGGGGEVIQALYLAQGLHAHSSPFLECFSLRSLTSRTLLYSWGWD